MKRLGLVVATLVVAAVWTQAMAQENKVVYIGHDKVAQGGPLTSGPGYIMSINRRTGVGMSEVHEKETDTFYVISGAATFVTGGEPVDLKPTMPGQLRGASINGGDVHHLTKGDVIVIPAGVPHWFKDVPQSPFEYYLIKVIKP